MSTTQVSQSPSGLGLSQQEPLLVNVEQAAHLLGVSCSTLRRMTQTGEIRSVRARKRILYSLSLLRLWVQGINQA